MMFKCETCEKVLSSKSVLTRHFRDVHKICEENDKKFGCSVCDKRFTNAFTLKRHIKDQHSIKIQCSSCEQKFENQKELHKHQRKDHDHNDKENSDKVCGICDKSMTSEAILRRHLMTQHDVTPESGQGSSCPICNTFKGNAKEIERHLENVHKLLLEEDKFTSETLEGFRGWKEKMEQETMCFYAKPCGDRKIQGGYTMHYRCFRSGTKRHTGNNERISRKDSVKINACCPSRIKAKVTKEGKVEVTFWKTHVGHENSIEHLYLTKTQKANLPTKLNDGVSVDTIIDQLEEHLINGISVVNPSSNLAESVTMQSKFAVTMETIQGLAMQIKPEEIEKACEGADKFMTHLMKIINSRPGTSQDTAEKIELYNL